MLRPDQLGKREQAAYGIEHGAWSIELKNYLPHALSPLPWFIFVKYFFKYSFYYVVTILCVTPYPTLVI